MTTGTGSKPRIFNEFFKVTLEALHQILMATSFLPLPPADSNISTKPPEKKTWMKRVLEWVDVARALPGDNFKIGYAFKKAALDGRVGVSPDVSTIISSEYIRRNPSSYILKIYVGFAVRLTIRHFRKKGYQISDEFADLALYLAEEGSKLISVQMLQDAAAMMAWDDVAFPETQMQMFSMHHLPSQNMSRGDDLPALGFDSAFQYQP